MKAGDMVKINDDTEWNGMCGIIDMVDGDIAFVFCVQRPSQLHPVFFEKLINMKNGMNSQCLKLLILDMTNILKRY